MPKPQALLFHTKMALQIACLFLLLASMARGQAAQSGIGGPFSLIDGAGGITTDRDFRGHYLLIFFGYTNCPDQCPTALSKIARALAALPGTTVRAAFVTVDPARDTATIVGRYAQLFSPRIEGLTGTPAELHSVEQEYHVFVSPDPQTGAIAHSALIYLMGPDGRFITLFPDNISSTALAAFLAHLPPPT